MHQDSAHKEGSTKLLFTYVGVIVACGIIFSDKIKSLAPMFQLTEADVYMIPVGAVFFIIFWKLSERFLFLPFIELIDAREAATSGSEEQSRQISDQAQLLLDNTEAQMFSARGQAARARDEQLNKTRALCNANIAEANLQAKDKMDLQRKAIIQEAQGLRKNLEEQIGQLAKDVVERIKRGATDEVQA